VLVGCVQFFSKVASEVRASDRHQVLDGHERSTFKQEYLATSYQTKGFLERNFDVVGSLHDLLILLSVLRLLGVEANVVLVLLPDRVGISERLVLDA